MTLEQGVESLITKHLEPGICMKKTLFTVISIILALVRV